MVRPEVVEKLRFLPVVVLKRFLKNGEINEDEFKTKVQYDHWPKYLKEKTRREG